MRRLLSGLFLALEIGLTAGCGERTNPQPAVAPPSATKVQPANPNPPSAPANANPAAANPAATNEQRAAKKPPDRARPKQREVARAEAAAMKAVTSAIRSSVEIGPTLVVWVIDSTSSAHEIVHEVSAAAENFYESPEVTEWSVAAEKPL